MSLGRFLVSILNLAPSSHLRHLSIRSSLVDVSGLVSGLVFEPGSELPFATLVDQIELRGSLVSFLVSSLNLVPSSRLRHLSIRSRFEDVSGFVAGLDSEPGSEAHLRCLSSESSFVDVSGLVSEPGSEGSFAMLVEKIKLRLCFWSRF